MNGGAKGTGAPPGIKNALKSGFYTKEAIEELKALNQLIRDAQRMLREFEI